MTQLSAGQVGHHFPQFLPDGIHVLYYVGGTPEVRGDYVGTLDGKLSRRLVDARSPAAFLPPGHVLFVRENALFAQALDPIRFELTGNAVRIADSVLVSSGIGGTDPAAMSASNTGDILYRSAAADSRRQLTWIDRSGRVVAQVGSSDSATIRSETAVSLSPDGRRVALARGAEGNKDIWLVDLERTGAMSRFTFSANNTLGVWSRDGRRLAFASTRNGNLDLYQRSIDGDRDEPLLVAPRHQAPVDWSPDGRTLLYLDADPKTHLDVWALPIGGDDKPVPVIQSLYEDLNPQFSPDGAWIAYQSDVSTRHETARRSASGMSTETISHTARDG